MILTLLLAALAVFAVWEYLLILLPWSVPPVLQPLLVVGLGYGSTFVDPRWVFPVAVAGAVALLHSVVGGPPIEPITFQMPPRSGRRSEVGSRVPPLP